MKFLIFFALLMSIAWARPQRIPISGGNNRNPFLPQQFPGGGNNRNPFQPPTNNNNGGNGNAIRTTTVAPSVPTTASPQYLACLQSCPSTMEYNPICGSDSINYHNNGRLSCAQRCGKNVSALRIGTCNAL